MSTPTRQPITRRVLTSRPVVGGVALIALAAAGLAGCGDDAGVEVTGAWARTSPAMVTAGAAYMTISSDEAVQIVGARVDPEVAGTVELHEVVPAELEDDAMSDEDGEMADGEMSEDEMSENEMADGELEDGEHGGMEMAMTMQEVSSIDIPAGGTVTFEPGGYHVMLLDLPDPLETGEEFDVTLVMSDDTELIVPVVVREDAP